MPQTELFRVAKNMKRANPAFNPIPASSETKRPLGKWGGDTYLFERDFPKREAWEPGCNLGLLVSDEYVVIDVDNKTPAIKSRKLNYSEATGVADFQTLIANNEPLPQTLTVTTPSGGKHYYFALTGREDELKLKNWTACMKLDGKLVAVDLSDQYKVPMAPLPNWILNNIVGAHESHEKHFEVQQYTSEPSVNEAPTNDDVATFKASPWWQPCFEIEASPDSNNFYIITAKEPYNCDICERRHVNNTNHPFLVRNAGTLRFVCRPGKGFNVLLEEDSLNKWAQFHPSTKQLIETMDITNRAVSEVLHGDLKDSVFPTMKPLLWRVFIQETGIWRDEFRNVIMRPLVDTYVRRAKQLHKICIKLQKAEDDTWNERAKMAALLAYSLSMTKKKDDHLQALFELVRDSRKEDIFNSKKHLLHCANGVYDLKEKRFRKAERKDYSTMSTQIKYVPYDEHPEEKRQLLEKHLDDIMLGRNDLIDFLLKVISSSLDGFIVDQQFYMFHGRGANAKSLLVKLIKRALGDYAAPIPSSQVTKPTLNAQSATPSLSALENKRGAFLTEMEDKVMYTELIKMAAGGDETSGRKLFKDQKNILLSATIFIAVNDLPTIEDKTHGFWQELVLIPFDAKFIDTEPKHPNEKRIIEGFEDQLLECADTFLALLIKTYITTYATEG
ncbi:hypothetical protein HK097_005885, partial [Rhizophlyctis rosea]